MIVLAIIALLCVGFIAGLLYANDRMITLLTESAGKQSVEIDGRHFQLVPEDRYTELLLADLYEKRDEARKKAMREAED